MFYLLTTLSYNLYYSREQLKNFKGKLPSMTDDEGMKEFIKVSGISCVINNDEIVNRPKSQQPRFLQRCQVDEHNISIPLLPLGQTSALEDETLDLRVAEERGTVAEGMVSHGDGVWPCLKKQKIGLSLKPRSISLSFDI